MRPRRRSNGDDVPEDGLAGVDLLDQTAHLQKLLDSDHGREIGDGVLGELEHLGLGILIGVTDVHLDHEPVQLGVRQGVGAFVLDGVLGGDHAERLREVARQPVHRNRALLHRLQQRALGLGAGPVDLIGEDHVGEDGPGPELEISLSLVVDVESRNVGRKKIGGELYPAKLGPQRTGERLGQKRLAHTGDILYKDVPACEYGHHGQKDTLTLARNSTLDVPDNAFHPLRKTVVVQRSPVYVRWTQGIISYSYQHAAASPACQHTPAYGCRLSASQFGRAQADKRRPERPKRADKARSAVLTSGGEAG